MRAQGRRRKLLSGTRGKAKVNCFEQHGNSIVRGTGIKIAECGTLTPHLTLVHQTRTQETFEMIALVLSLATLSILITATAIWD